MAVTTLGEPRIRTLLGASATGAATGVVMSVLDLPEVGAVLTVGSLLLLLYAVHSFGRVGADLPTVARRRRRRRAGP